MTGDAPPLADLQVLEICAHADLPLGGRTLAELGAEVIRIDPAKGEAESAERRWTVAELLATSGPHGGIVLTWMAGQAWLRHAERATRRSDLIHLQVPHREDLADRANDSIDMPSARVR